MSAAHGEEPEILSVLREKYNATITPCGSRVTCDPPPTDTDRDYLVRLPNQSRGPGAESVVISNVVETLSDANYRLDGTEHYQHMISTDFMSFKLDDVNLIVTMSPEFVEKHELATGVCRVLNLMRKEDRVAVFQWILYGNSPTTEEKTHEKNSTF